MPAGVVLSVVLGDIEGLGSCGVVEMARSAVLEDLVGRPADASLGQQMLHRRKEVQAQTIQRRRRYNSTLRELYQRSS